ncbi:unnamed protein product, partial [Allacma fusca]
MYVFIHVGLVVFYLSGLISNNKSVYVFSQPLYVQLLPFVIAMATMCGKWQDRRNGQG